MALARICIVFALMLAASSAAVAGNGKDAQWHGVNLAGGGFTPQALPGVHGKDYLYPSAATIRAYAQAGFNTIRVPFLWERMQPRLGGLLSPQELKLLDGVVIEAKRQHLTVILDLHNFGLYRDAAVGSKAVSVEAFAHVWMLLARHYRDQPHVVFGIMNEPNKQTADEWAVAARAALKSIRDTGATQPVLVPGTLFSGMHSWNNKAGAHSNAEALRSFNDRSVYIEVHQYFDANHSGTGEECVAPEKITEAFEQMTDWLAKTHHRAVLGEFGAAGSEACIAMLNTAMQHIAAHPAQWKGWAYWGASEWFGNYPYNIYPVDEKLHPQLTALKAHMK